MIYGESDAINYKEQKQIKFQNSVSPLYKNYMTNISKNINNKNETKIINSYLKEKENRNKKNLYLNSNSVSKTTKNSPRNIFFQYNNNYYNKYKNNNNNNHYIKYETNINSPRKTLVKNVNFKSKKLNLNVKTLNMNLEINKYNDITTNNNSDNEESNILSINNRNISVFKTKQNNRNDNSFILKEYNNQKKNDLNKIELNNLRNQLNKILSNKNRSLSHVKKNSNNMKNNNYNRNEIQKTCNYTNDNSFIEENYILTENKNNKSKNKCILLKDKNTYKKLKEKKRRNELNIKLFNSLKNNFIGIKLPNKKIIKNENIENYSNIHNRNRNQRNRQLRASKTQIEYEDNSPSSIIKMPKLIKKDFSESNSIDKEINLNNNDSLFINKIFNTDKTKKYKKEKDETSKDYNTILSNENVNINTNIKNQIELSENKKYEELENKYEALFQSYKKLKDENINLIDINKSLKQKNQTISEENHFLNNYIISIKKIIASIITTYSQEIQKLTQIVKQFTKNSKFENSNIINKVRIAIDNYSLQELEKDKKINFILKQLLTENQFLRNLLIKQRNDKNYFLKEKQKQTIIDKEYKLNFDYDYLRNFNKKGNDFEKQLHLNISFNNSTNKNNSVQKKIKNEKYYEANIIHDNTNIYDENNKILEKKKIKYNKIKK